MAALLALKQRSEHLVVIGAGYIGLELAKLFRHLGSRVTLTQRGGRVSDAARALLLFVPAPGAGPPPGAGRAQ